jgi:hypothetical protein
MVRKSIALGTSSLSSDFPAIFSLPPTTKSKSLFVITADLYAASSRGWADICSRNDDFVGAIADHRARQRGRASPHVSDGLPTYAKPVAVEQMQFIQRYSLEFVSPHQRS